MIGIDSYWDYNYPNNEEHYGNGYPSKSEDRAHVTPDKVCRYCGKTGLEWLETTGGWRLVDWGGKIHECSERRKLLTKVPPKQPKAHSSKVYDLLSNAIQGNHLSEKEGKEYDRLKKYFKDNGMTVEELTKEDNYPRFS